MSAHESSMADDRASTASSSKKRKMDASQHRQPQSRIRFTLDVLTDGSEYTGHGTLFLSVWKTPLVPVTDDDDNEEEQTIIQQSTLLARYAISGLGDALARLCADQRFKLAAATRALFVPCHNGGCMDGFAALLLGLHGAGSPSLHVVMPPERSWNGKRNGKEDDDLVEKLTNLVLGKHKHLAIQTCTVQRPNKNGNGGIETPWWKVFEDEYLEVHACCRKTGDTKHTDNQHQNHSGNSTQQFMPWSVIYLYSFSLGGDDAEPMTTMAVLPPRCANTAELYKQHFANTKALPLLRNNASISTIDYVISLDPSNHKELSDVATQYSSTIYLATIPSNEGLDTGLLMRSHQLAQRFHSEIPWAFPAPPTESFSARDNEQHFTVLKSGTSLVLKWKSESSNTSFVVLDRRNDILAMDVKQEWDSTVESLQRFVPRPPSAADDNEIELDDEDDESSSTSNNDNPFAATDDHAMFPGTARLLVLGTGCATPSPYRGGSGYALIVPEKDGPKELMHILDCGEGLTTMLLRNCETNFDWKRRIDSIWISHAHLDHYGGLPTLLRALHIARGNSSTFNRSGKNGQHRYPSLVSPSVPRVMAPRKVLHYLDMLLGCHHGQRPKNESEYEQIFFPMCQDDPTRPCPMRGQWSYFQNIKVQHNCCPAYGLLLGWIVNNGHQNPSQQLLCFSGDTQPCLALVQACRKAVAGYSNSTLTLIHEATFADEELEDARKKKHSTMSEALKVAEDIPASKVLLTHFSRRYISLKNTKEPNQQSSSILMGLAADGLWFPFE